MGITYGKLIFCHGVSKGNLDKEIPMREYNNRKVYDCFNNPFLDDFGSPSFNLPTITIHDIPLPRKIYHYTPDMIPDTISAASENSVSNFTTPSDSPQLHILTSHYPNPPHGMKKYEPYSGRVKRGYNYSKRDEKYYTKRQYYIDPHALIKTRSFITVIGF